MLTITDARVVIDTHAEPVDCEILIDGNRIKAIKKDFLPGEKENVICARGQLILPGFIDVHAHILDPLIPASNFANASEMALRGGVTTILEMPTSKPTMCAAAVNEKVKRASKESIVDFAFHAGNMAAEYLGSVKELKGIVTGVKGFMCAPYALGIDELRQFIAESNRNGLLPMLHCEDEMTVQNETRKYLSLHNPEIYPLSRPAIAEKIAIENASSVVRENEHLHIVHVSSRAGVDALKTAKNRCKNISAEACPHHLILTADKMHTPKLKMNPPLRTADDCTALWSALNLGTIDFVATDHFYVDADEKERDIWSAPAGVPGLEVLCPAMFTYGVKKMGISLFRFVQITSGMQARRFGLMHKGAIAPGMDADMLIVNTRDTKRFKSKFWSPYEGMEFSGYPETVILRGKVVYADGQVLEKPGYGKYLRA